MRECLPLMRGQLGRNAQKRETNVRPSTLFGLLDFLLQVLLRRAAHFYTYVASRGGVLR